MRIPDSVIEELKGRMPLSELIDREASPNKLKKSGNGNVFTACCPFHEEKTPSFNINDDKGLYNCFGCGEGGTHIDFLMSYRNLNFREAVTALADIVGVDLQSRLKQSVNTSDTGSDPYFNKSSIERLSSRYLQDMSKQYSSTIFFPEPPFSIPSYPQGRDTYLAEDILGAMRCSSVLDYKRWLTSKPEQVELAKQSGVVVDGDIRFPNAKWMIPIFGLSAPEDTSALPILRGAKGLVQLNCQGYLSVNELDHIRFAGLYPSGQHSVWGGLLMPFASSIAIAQACKELRLLPGREALVSSMRAGNFMAIAPAIGGLTQAHVSNIGRLPVSSLKVELEADFLAKPNAIESYLNLAMSMNEASVKFVLENGDAIGQLPELIEHIGSTLVSLSLPQLERIESALGRYVNRCVREEDAKQAFGVCRSFAKVMDVSLPLVIDQFFAVDSSEKMLTLSLLGRGFGGSGLLPLAVEPCNLALDDKLLRVSCALAGKDADYGDIAKEVSLYFSDSKMRQVATFAAASALNYLPALTTGEAHELEAQYQQCIDVHIEPLSGVSTESSMATSGA
ncbi:CHC2 zinc finger domain-containing protein [Aliagarivorans taiwanensis]|uniref:CHC2 zinc finger domain-containing protein n=1 Tax=Aliagarivorans taiwanensis TaxID=561966 RepID=UPI000413722F|nr:CHC2 zinc finger domain-containing protein [Aliagarivorans taiwanensis]